MTKINDIEQLLAIYYEGKTSLSQEQTLIEYFTSAVDIPQHLLADRDIMLALHNSRHSLPDDIVEELSALIDRLDAGEQISKRLSIRRAILRYVGIAASIAIIALVGITFLSHPGNSRIECTDPEMAYTETEQALILLSQKLNKANRGVDDADEAIDKFNNIFSNSLNNR